MVAEQQSDWKTLGNRCIWINVLPQLVYSSPICLSLHLKTVSIQCILFPKPAINDQQLTFSYVVQSASPSSHSIPWFSHAESAPGDLSQCWTLPPPVDTWEWQRPLLVTAAMKNNNKSKSQDWLTDRQTSIYLSINFLNLLFGLLLNEGHHVLYLQETNTKQIVQIQMTLSSTFIENVVAIF